MGPPRCLRCQHEISVDDTVAFEGDTIAHLDCRRPRDLNSEERALLFKYCFDHVVAACDWCAKSYRQHELAGGPNGQSHTPLPDLPRGSYRRCTRPSVRLRDAAGRGSAQSA